MQDKIKYWVEIADYDFDTAIAMLESNRLLYVGFMCHQVIEKMIKAFWSKTLEEPPLKIHTLSRLAEISDLKTEMSSEQWDFIIELQPLNIEARYPQYKEMLFQKLTPSYCREVLEKTKDLKQWILERL